MTKRGGMPRSNRPEKLFLLKRQPFTSESLNNFHEVETKTRKIPKKEFVTPMFNSCPIHYFI